jgi:hypothetical protein
MVKQSTNGTMKVASLAEWLKSHGLERLTEIFEQNEVDLSTLRVLTESDLKELGLPFGPRKRILHLLSDERAHHKVEELGDHVGAPSGERRQLTVLFCDLVGSTKLAYKHVLVLKFPAGHPAHVVAHNDGTRLGYCLQTGREVQRFAHHVPLAARDHHHARGDADANLQSSRARYAQSRHGVYDIEPGADGAFGLRFVRERKSEKGYDSVP